MNIASSSPTALGLGLGLLALLGLGSATGCAVVSIFTCAEDQNCIDEGGEGGVCESNSQCTFPDAGCPSGKRWHERAVEDLAGNCFDPSDVGGSGGATDTGGSGGATGSGSDDGGTSTTASGDDPQDGSSGGPPPMTDGGSTGSAGSTCDELFGTASGYELCEETADSCSFNVILDMTSCNDLCGSFGSTCVAAFNNSASDCASNSGATTCDEVVLDQICVCSK